MEKDVAGIDLGYGAIKAVSGREAFSFPSTMALDYVENPTFFPKIQSNGFSPDKKFYLVFKGRKIAFGFGAVGNRDYRRISRGEAEDFDEKFLIYSLGILSDTEREKTFDVAIPFHYLVSKEKIKAVKDSLSHREFSFSIINQKEHMEIPKKIYVENVYPTRQALSVLWDELLENVSSGITSGKVTELLENTFIVVDIGTGTTELVVVSKNRILEQHCKSLKLGIYDIVYSLKQYFSRKYGYSGVSSVLIEDEIIRSGKTLLGGGKIDITDIIEREKEKLWDTIEAELASLLGTLQDTGLFSVRNIVFTGGGSLFLDDKIRTFSGKSNAVVRVAKRRLFSNAYGARKMALALERAVL